MIVARHYLVGNNAAKASCSSNQLLMRSRLLLTWYLEFVRRTAERKAKQLYAAFGFADF